MTSCQLSAFRFSSAHPFGRQGWLKTEKREVALFLDDAEDFFLSHDQKLLAVDLDFGAGILAEQHTVASLHIQREDLAFIVRLALSDGDDFAFVGLFFGAIRNDDSAMNGIDLFRRDGRGYGREAG